MLVLHFAFTIDVNKIFLNEYCATGNDSSGGAFDSMRLDPYDDIFRNEKQRREVCSVG